MISNMVQSKKNFVPDTISLKNGIKVEFNLAIYASYTKRNLRHK